MKNIAVLTCAVLTVSAPALTQGLASEQTTFEFTGPVQVPGRTLPAGRYQFRLATPASSQQVVQIWNENRTELMTTVLSIPTERRDVSGDIYVTFARTPESDPPALKSWFYPGELTGHMFVYPEEQARRIAATTKELVLSADALPEQVTPSTSVTYWVVLPEGGRQEYRDQSSLQQRSRSDSAASSNRTAAHQYRSSEPPNVAAAAADRADGSGRVSYAKKMGLEDARRHLDSIDGILDSALNGSERGEGRTIQTGQAAADLHHSSQDVERLRDHVRQARQALANEGQPR